MSTRAIQLDILLSGLRDPDTGFPLAGGVVSFYGAGTTTAKNVWSEKDKTTAYTSITLDSNGSVASPYYGDGWYKIIVTGSDGAVEYTWDQVYLQSNSFSVAQKTSAYTVTPDDDVIYCNGTFTVSLESVATFEHPILIKNIGTGTITVTPYGSETLSGGASASLTELNSSIFLYPDTTSTIWRKGPLNELNRKVISIGDWNIDSTLSINVAHGLTPSKIRGISGVIFNDDGLVYSITKSDELDVYCGTTNVTITATSSGAFDNTSFNQTSYNRGFIVLDYVD
jgi:hypothetical protein